MDSVIRYVPTYVNKDGIRTLMLPAQGRNTFETCEQAQQWIDSVIRNNSEVRSIWGGNPRFEVRPCPCWPRHFDPQTIWFEPQPARRDGIRNQYADSSLIFKIQVYSEPRPGYRLI
jgi:hypothetical protein